MLDDAEFAGCIHAMARALDARDEAALSAAVTAFERARKTCVNGRVRRVANDLQFALQHFESNAHLLEMAQRQAPDVRHRLAHVLTLTADAAHRTMDLVERSAPLADWATREAQRLIALQQQIGSPQELAPQLKSFLPLIASSIAEVRSNLAEVLITQEYQDLSGQIIRGVMQLIQELEVALAQLLLIAGPEHGSEGLSSTRAYGRGAAIPGIDSAVGGQQDVDALLSELGV